MRAASFTLALAIAAAAAANAQTSSTAVVRVTARDSSGAPITSAELTITRGLRDVVAHGTTDARGLALLTLPVKDSTDFQVTMRKIGYLRGDRFFSVGPRDTTNVAVVVAPPRGAALAPVKITAEADLRWKSYHLDADDIEKSDAPLDNAWEVIKHLRPYILTSRGGCPGVQEVWVNGKRVVLPLYPIGMAAARARVGVPPRARFSYVAVSVLSDIAPEHIAEMTYHDCFDSSMGVVGGTNALVVVLKPGVVYQQDVGSFVVENADRR